MPVYLSNAEVIFVFLFDLPVFYSCVVLLFSYNKSHLPLIRFIQRMRHAKRKACKVLKEGWMVHFTDRDPCVSIIFPSRVDPVYQFNFCFKVYRCLILIHLHSSNIITVLPVLRSHLLTITSPKYSSIKLIVRSPSYILVISMQIRVYARFHQPHVHKNTSFPDLSVYS